MNQQQPIDESAILLAGRAAPCARNDFRLNIAGPLIRSRACSERSQAYRLASTTEMGGRRANGPAPDTGG